MSAPTTGRTVSDPVDGRPTRAVRAGTRLLPGHLAWRCLAVGHRLETWLTWSLDHWTPTVVKLPRPDQLDHPRARATLAREAGALRGPAHPGLPRLLAGDPDADPPHVVLEWLDGPTLDDVIDSHGPLPAGDALALASQLAAAVRWLHRGRTAHLDLTPANVIVRDGWPVLIDLGAARPFGTPGGPGEIGTPGYAAPELEHGGPVTAAMALYGLGAVLRAAITAPGHEGPPDGHPLSGAVTALLAPDPDDRPRDADELLSLLHAAGDAETGPPWPRFAERRRPSGAPTP